MSLNTKWWAYKENERAWAQIEHVRQGQEENERMQTQLEQDMREMRIEKKRRPPTKLGPQVAHNAALSGQTQMP